MSITFLSVLRSIFAANSILFLFLYSTIVYPVYSLKFLIKVGAEMPAVEYKREAGICKSEGSFNKFKIRCTGSDLFFNVGLFL